MKYFATLGPNFNKTKDIVSAIELGLTGIRINLSHSNLEDCKTWLDNIKEADSITGRKTEILLDIKGAELRVKTLGDIDLKSGDRVMIQSNPDSVFENSIIIPELALKELELNDVIHIDDGKVVLKVLQVFDNSIKATALDNSTIKNGKSFSIMNKQIKLDPVSQDDINNFIYSKKYDIKSFMLPFVRSEKDVVYLKNTLEELDISNYIIYSKIEDIIGFKNIEDICKYSDEIVIARGDLGNNVGLLEVAKIQKKISKICKKHNKPFMVVTELLYSMIERPTPTRAEINDIYNSTLDGASSLMVTGETAIGKYPLKSIEYLINASKI